MGCLGDIFNVLVTLCSSIFDVGSDFINSLDFLGYNVSTTIAEKLVGATNDTEIYEVHQVWGYVGLGIIWLPGLLLLPWFVLVSVSSKSCLYFILGLVLFATYPLAMIVVEIGFLIHTCCNCKMDKGDNQMIMLFLIGTEAFYESFSQMVLQGFTIMYAYDPTNIQMLTIAASFLLLSKTVITYHITLDVVSLSLCQKMIQILKSIPIYCSSIVFRVFSFVLTISYLRNYSIFPISILFIELGLLAYIRYRNEEFGDKQHPYARWVNIYTTTVSNAGVLNISTIKNASNIKDEDVKATRKFIRLSSITTFIHHSIVLITILMVVIFHPDYLTDEQFKYLILKPENKLFYPAFGVTIAIGLVSMILCITLASKMNIVKKPTVQESTIEMEEKKSLSGP